MSSYKRILGDYNIVSVQPQLGDNVNVVTHSVNITGNLNVAGNITYIDVSELVVNDPFITVAGNNAGAGAGATFPQQGLVAQTGNTGTPTFAGLRFNNDTTSWQISSNVTAAGAAITAYSDIALGGASAPGQPANSIQFNIGNVFTGNTNFTFDYSVSQVSLDGSIALKRLASVPSAIATTQIIYANTPGSGGTGLYIRDSTISDELVSKTKAIVFGIIF
jgi:hypothetical protein